MHTAAPTGYAILVKGVVQMDQSMKTFFISAGDLQFCGSASCRLCGRVRRMQQGGQFDGADPAACRRRDDRLQRDRRK